MAAKESKSTFSVVAIEGVEVHKGTGEEGGCVSEIEVSRVETRKPSAEILKDPGPDFQRSQWPTTLFFRFQT